MQGSYNKGNPQKITVTDFNNLLLFKRTRKKIFGSFSNTLSHAGIIRDELAALVHAVLCGARAQKSFQKGARFSM